MDYVFIIGITAAVCTTISFLPQVIKTYRTRHTKDLSLGMLCLLSFGVSCWTTYGFLIKDAPVLLANSVTLVLVAYILVMKIRLG
jgi:MtN3 and saliva related transmembrane protein